MCEDDELVLVECEDYPSCCSCRSREAWLGILFDMIQHGRIALE
jgi:hypothetical protein